MINICAYSFDPKPRNEGQPGSRMIHIRIKCTWADERVLSLYNSNNEFSGLDHQIKIPFDLLIFGYEKRVKTLNIRTLSVLCNLICRISWQ